MYYNSIKGRKKEIKVYYYKILYITLWQVVQGHLYVDYDKLKMYAIN